MDLVQINDFLATIDGYIGGSSWFVFALLGSGIFFTLYLGFPRIRYFGHAVSVVRGKFDKDGAKGDTAPCQSLTTGFAGTVGTGTITGEAVGSDLGGGGGV